MQGLDWQVLRLSLGAGLMQRMDDRARQPPFLDIAKDIQFDELGAIQTRYPYGDLSATPDPLTNARRVVPHNGELLVFTKDELLSYFEDQDTFITRATYLAVKPTETPRFVTIGDQNDVDTARLSGIVYHCFTEGSLLYLGITDEATDAVVLAPISITGSRPRLVALGTKVLLFWVNAGVDLVVRSLDPAGDPADVASELASPTTVLAAAAFNVYYDVARLLGVDTAIVACRRQTTTSYSVGTVTAAASVTMTTKARTCNGPIAIASHPAGTSVEVVRTNIPSVEGDLMTVAGPFTDTNVGSALGAAPNTVEAVTAAFRSVANGGQFRCYAFWTGDTGSSPHVTEYNYVDTAGSLGTETTLARRFSLASRAFDHDGRVFVNVAFTEASNFTGAVFAQQLQSTIFLVRDDGLRCGKHLASRAAVGADYTTQVVLPGVQNTGANTFTWCALEKRRFDVAISHQTHADRGPCDVTIEFDSDEARRVAQIGQTLYVAGAEIMQHDGVRLTEVGWPIFPWSFTATEAASGGIITNGTYAAKVTWASTNATGERERSTTATVGEVTIAAQPAGITYTILPLALTHKASAAIEVWRTEVNPTADSSFYLTTNPDPSDTAGSNCFVINAPASSSVSFTDELADSTLTDREGHPENGALLENLAPPAASIIIASDTRLFLAGVAGDPHRVVYSKIRAAGQVASFHDALAVDVPRAGGDITALALLSETLVVFRETAIYVLPGQGFGNFGDADGSQNFGPARMLANDCGAVSHEAVALTSDGLIFKSSKGWYLLNRGFALEYIGAAVKDHDAETVHAIHVLETQHEIRVLTSGRMLFFDTVAKQWGERTIDDGIHACMWRGVHHVLTATSVRQQLSTYTGLDYGLDVETAWIKPADLQGWARIRWIMLLAEYRSAHDVRIRVAYDFVETYVDDVPWTVSPTTIGGPEQMRLGPSRQQCQAFKVRITAQAVGSATPPTGEALKLTGLGVELGFRKGLYRRLVAAQKV